MKQFLSLTLILSLFIVMLCFPQETFLGASTGLLLWFQTILPTLLPFIILSNLMIRTNAVLSVSNIIKPLFHRLFATSDYGCYAVFVGFLCGYPMGAKVTADLLKSNRITKQEAQYLLSFCNNTSPMFVISYLVMQNLKNESLLWGTISILYLSPFVCSLFFRRYYSISKHQPESSTAKSERFTFHFQLVDDCIMNGFETITKVGGYLILFSILFVLGSRLPVAALLPSLEISNGISYVIGLNLPLSITYPWLLALTSFGGFCAIAQSYSMIQDVKLQILPYIIQKLITALVTSLFAFLYMQFIH